MLIIHSGQNVYGYDKAAGKFKQLPLTYEKYPSEPTPESLNEGLAWLLDFLKRKALPYTIQVDEEESKGPMETTEIVYADIVASGGSVRHNLAVYTVCTNITMGTTANFEISLLEELT